MIGPPVGPKPYIDCALPRSSRENMSPMVAPPRLGPAEAAIPESSRRIVKAVILGDSAQPMLRMVKTPKETR